MIRGVFVMNRNHNNIELMELENHLLDELEKFNDNDKKILLHNVTEYIKHKKTQDDPESEKFGLSLSKLIPMIAGIVLFPALFYVLFIWIALLVE